VKVSELGEFGLIARLAEAFASGSRPASLVIGIGDDAAAWKASGVQLVTTDTLIEGTHFFLPQVPWRDLGWNALTVNVSDIAAMGGIPEQALLTLALPPQTEVTDVDELLAGMLEASHEFGISIVGGDIVGCDKAMVTVTLIGQALAGDEGQPLLMTRSGAQAGDAIAVTGYLGDSAGGLRILLGESRGPEKAAEHLKRTHLHHMPPLAVGQMAGREGVRAAIDVSDGLLQDLGHVCQASGAGAIVHAERIPISPELREAFPEDALALACTGGEDYQLLLAAQPGVIQRVQDKTDVPITVVGEMVADRQHRVRLLGEDGRELALPGAGWDHLRGTAWRR
jgi:thiamine-monophosphate kinase